MAGNFKSQCKAKGAEMYIPGKATREKEATAHPEKLTVPHLQ